MAKKKPAIVLVMRTCNADMTSEHDKNFKWPESGRVEAPDWRDDGECGHGLHGNLWGGDDPSYFSTASDAKWLVCEVQSDLIRDIGGKRKFPWCNVVYCGDMRGAAAFIVADKRTPSDAVVHGAVKTAGSFGTANAGDRGTATAGDFGIATGGDRTSDGEGKSVGGRVGDVGGGICG